MRRCPLTSMGWTYGFFPIDNGLHLNNSSFASLATYGRPIITTRGPHVEDALTHRESVFLVRSRNPQELVLAIEELTADVGLRQHLGASALKLADDLFSWRSAGDAYAGGTWCGSLAERQRCRLKKNCTICSRGSRGFSDSNPLRPECRAITILVQSSDIQKSSHQPRSAYSERFMQELQK